MKPCTLIIGFILITTFTSCSRQNSDKVATLQSAVNSASKAIGVIDSASSSSYSSNHSEYQQTNVTSLTLETKEDATKVSSSIKNHLTKSGFEILMFNSHATIRSEKGGWSGSIESIMESELRGDQSGMDYGASSGSLANIENLFISSVMRTGKTTFLLHCRLFPEEHRVHFSAVTINQNQ